MHITWDDSRFQFVDRLCGMGFENGFSVCNDFLCRMNENCLELLPTKQSYPKIHHVVNCGSVRNECMKCCEQSSIKQIFMRFVGLKIPFIILFNKCVICEIS